MYEETIEIHCTYVVTKNTVSSSDCNRSNTFVFISKSLRISVQSPIRHTGHVGETGVVELTVSYMQNDNKLYHNGLFNRLLPIWWVCTFLLIVLCLIMWSYAVCHNFV